MVVAISGASGYLGSHLCDAFLQAGCEVVALKRRASGLQRLEHIRQRLRFVDVDGASTDRLFAADVPDVVIHSATRYGRNGETVEQVAGANLHLPMRLLKDAMDAGARAFVNVDTILPPSINDYARTKHEFRVRASQAVEGSHTKFINIRAGNMYGPWDDDTKFTSHVIRSCAAQVPVLDLTPGEQERDFVYVDDAVAAFMLVAQRFARDEDGGTVHFDLATGVRTSVRQFAETAHRLTRSRTHLDFGAIAYREGEPMTQSADASALASLGWKPRFGVEEGIARTVEAEHLV